MLVLNTPLKSDIRILQILLHKSYKLMAMNQIKNKNKVMLLHVCLVDCNKHCNIIPIHMV